MNRPAARKPDALDALLRLAEDDTEEGYGLRIWATNREDPPNYRIDYPDGEICLEGDGKEIRRELEGLARSLSVPEVAP